jgi:phosphinothricin acetyltransferase
VENSLSIRLATPADAAAVAAIYAPVVLETAISFEYAPPPVTEMAMRIEETLRLRPWLIGEIDGEVVGYAYASEHRARAAYQWSVDVSIYLSKDHRRKGLGKKLYGALFDLLRRQGYHHFYAGVTLPNEASRRLHEAMGMTPVGVYRAVGFKFGQWHDVGWWQGELRPTSQTPQKPRPITEIILPGSELL